MKKIEFELSSTLYEQSLIPIRRKYDLLELLSHTIKFLVSSPIPKTAPERDEKNEKKLVLYIDKMSRLLFCAEDKIFTFNFPLQVDMPGDRAEGRLSLRYKDFLQIDSMASSLLLSIFSQREIFEGPLESIGERIFQEIIDNEWEGMDYEGLSELIKHFIFFEPGYLRYDHDPKNANGKLHPEHHLDIFFSSSNTMKVGLQSKIDKDWMLDLLDINTNCRYIS